MEFEARYIDVDWDADRNVLSVKYGEPIRILKVTDNEYEIETVTFKKTHFYFALRVLSENIKHTPFFFFKDKTEELLEVRDPLNGQVWWIAKGVWRKPKNINKWKYSHEVWRTAGRIELNIQDKLVKIDNRTNSFTVGELEYVLKDFKDELWNIILKTDSVITGNINRSIEQKVPNIFSDEVMHLVDLFIKSAQNILKKPKYILNETQGLQPIKKVRPVMRTFRELSTKPGSKQLTSRIHITSLNTTENKYAHYCVDKLYTLFNKLQEVAKISSDNLQEKADNYKSEASELLDKLNKPKVINKSVFERELQEITTRFNSIEKAFSNLFALTEVGSSNFTKELEALKADNQHLFAYSAIDENVVTRSFSVDGAMNSFQNTFFCNTLDGRDFRKDPCYERYGGKYLCVQYPEFIANFLKGYAGKNITVSITGTFGWEVLSTGYKFTCLSVFDITEGMSHELTLGTNVGSSNIDFFCNAIDGRKYNETVPNTVSRYLRVRFPSDVSDLISSMKTTNLTIRIVGSTKFELERDYEVISWSSINSIALVSHPLQNEIQRYEGLENKYEKNGWIDHYTHQERDEIINESKYLSSRAEKFSEKLQDFIPAANALSTQLQKIRKLKLEFKSLSIGMSSVFPSSMTYVQNPSYSGLHSSFKSILLKSNLSLSQLEKMLIIERVGLLSVSTLYERWVLLLIIKILSHDFGFIFEEGWEDKLIDAVRPSIKNIPAEVEFTAIMPNRQINLTLSYDKALPTSGRRPDYVLKIEHNHYELKDSIWTYTENPLNSTLVMDAKFYDDATESKIISTINELAIDKNYIERQQPSFTQGANSPIELDNRLFIIHPVKNIVSETSRSSPLVWGTSADYGHVVHSDHSTSDEDASHGDDKISYINASVALTKHKLGHVSVVPSKDKSVATDNLKRLILLHLQSVSAVLFKKEEDLEEGTKPISNQQPDWHNYFCPECNASELDLKVKSSITSGGGVKWKVVCGLCSFRFEENFCFSCKERLFKNGLKWTYHRTYAQMVTNCRCPNCDSDLYDLHK